MAEDILYGIGKAAKKSAEESIERGDADDRIKRLAEGYIKATEVESDALAALEFNPNAITMRNYIDAADMRFASFTRLKETEGVVFADHRNRRDEVKRIVDIREQDRQNIMKIQNVNDDTQAFNAANGPNESDDNDGVVYPHISIETHNIDISPLALVSRASKAMRETGVPENEIDDFLNDVWENTDSSFEEVYLMVSEYVNYLPDPSKRTSDANTKGNGNGQSLYNPNDQAPSGSKGARISRRDRSMPTITGGVTVSFR